MIAVVYGSSTENTKEVAQTITTALRQRVSLQVDLIDVATIKKDLTSLLNYQVLLLGCPTWNIGELQDDWYDAFPLLDTLDLSDTFVALFGCGDQHNFPDNFQDAIGILGIKARERGATLIGRWPTDGYDFDESQAVEEGVFIGLALDEDNQSDLTPSRIQSWVEQLVCELQLEDSKVSSR
ncbi:MAG: flavodoxin [Oscillochloris sp.]|nr:flavodoxin [Oscillochloris sp.]